MREILVLALLAVCAGCNSGADAKAADEAAIKILEGRFRRRTPRHLAMEATHLAAGARRRTCFGSAASLSGRMAPARSGGSDSNRQPNRLVKGPRIQSGHSDRHRPTRQRRSLAKVGSQPGRPWRKPCAQASRSGSGLDYFGALLRNYDDERTVSGHGKRGRVYNGC